jgi:hypothetical protein
MSNHIVVLDGVAGKIPNFRINSGSDANMNYMLAMRSNLVQYVHLIDIYGPCIVGASNWNNTDNMEQYCGNNASVFNDRVLSLSDEAFLLVVLINYGAEWMWKIEMETMRYVIFNSDMCSNFSI